MPNRILDEEHLPSFFLCNVGTACSVRHLLYSLLADPLSDLCEYKISSQCTSFFWKYNVTFGAGQITRLNKDLTRGLTLGIDGGFHLGPFIRLVERVERLLVGHLWWVVVILLEHQWTPRSRRIILK